MRFNKVLFFFSATRHFVDQVLMKEVVVKLVRKASPTRMPTLHVNRQNLFHQT